MNPTRTPTPTDNIRTVSPEEWEKINASVDACLNNTASALADALNFPSDKPLPLDRISAVKMAGEFFIEDYCTYVEDIYTKSSGKSLEEFLREHPLEDFRKNHEVPYKFGTIWLDDGSWLTLDECHETGQWFWTAHVRPEEPKL